MLQRVLSIGCCIIGTLGFILFLFGMANDAMVYARYLVISLMILILGVALLPGD